MPFYKYRAKKGVEDVVEGSLEANSQKEAIEKLSQLGYLPVRIEEGRVSVETRTALRKTTVRVKSRDITIMSRQLASLMRSGVPILTALNIIKDQSESINLKDILQNIHNAVKDGAAFSAVLGQYPYVFSPLYIAMVRTGEDSGTLPEVLIRIADYRRKQEEVLSRIRMAMAYPILMAIVGVGTIVFMLTFVMPRLMQIFLSMGQDLPLPTKIVIYTSKLLRQRWNWIGSILLIIVLMLRRQAQTNAGRLSLSVLKLRIPIFGKFVLKTELSRFSRTLELLLKNGVPILKAMEITIPVLDNEVLRLQLKQSYKELEQGGSFGRSLKNSKLFPAFMSNLITVGEESGRLDEALAEVASSYESDTDEMIRVMSNLLEPLMILGMGLIVGFIVLAMLLPIFEINVMTR